MNGAAPVQCVNCETEQSFARIYCAHCGCSLDAAKPLGQTWAGTFLIVMLLMIAATLIGFVLISPLLFGAEEAPIASLPDAVKVANSAMLVLALACLWGIGRLARR